jgi:hypothetical protein
MSWEEKELKPLKSEPVRGETYVLVDERGGRQPLLYHSQTKLKDFDEPVELLIEFWTTVSGLPIFRYARREQLFIYPAKRKRPTKRDFEGEQRRKHELQLELVDAVLAMQAAQALRNIAPAED